MLSVLRVARLAMRRMHMTAACRRAVCDMRKAMAALKAMRKIKFCEHKQ